MDDKPQIRNFSMIIESDHDKILREGKYKVDEFDSLLRSVILDTNFTEIKPGHYYLDAKYDPLGRMLVLDAKFDKLGIIPNLKTWKTYDAVEAEVDQLEDLE